MKRFFDALNVTFGTMVYDLSCWFTPLCWIGIHNWEYHEMTEIDERKWSARTCHWCFKSRKLRRI